MDDLLGYVSYMIMWWYQLERHLIFIHSVLELFWGLIIYNVSLFCDTSGYFYFCTVSDWLYHYFRGISIIYNHYVLVTLAWPNWEFTSWVWIYNVHEFILEASDCYQHVCIFLLGDFFCVFLFIGVRVYTLEFYLSQYWRGLPHMHFLRRFWFWKMPLCCFHRQACTWCVVSCFDEFQLGNIGW